MGSQNYIKLNRDILNWGWYANPATKILFLHCLLKANFEDIKYQGITVKKGAFVSTLSKLSLETGLSSQQVRSSLDHLVESGEISVETTTKYHIITVNDFDKYLDDEQEDECQDSQQTENAQSLDNQQTNNKQTTENQQLNNKQSTNEKQEKSIVLYGENQENGNEATNENHTIQQMNGTRREEEREEEREEGKREKKERTKERIDRKGEGKEGEKEEESFLTDSNESVCRTDVRLVIGAWNSLHLNQIRKLSPTSRRYKMLTSRIREYGKDDILKAIENVRESDFLRGNNPRGWTIDFEWFVRPNNFPKVLEGNYKNRDVKMQNQQQKPKVSITKDMTYEEWIEANRK